MNQYDFKSESKLIRRSSYRYIFPPMAGMVFAQCAPLVDSICVSGEMGTEALSAIATADPVNYAFNIIAALGGIGCGVMISRFSGSGEKEKAARIFTRTLLAMIAVTLILSIAAIIFIDPLLCLLCATTENFSYAKEYLTIVLAGAVFMVLNFAGDYLLANDNNASLAMAGDITGAVVNMAVDFIGVYVFHCGIRVVAFGTVLGSVCCFLVYLLHFRKKDRLCRIVLPERKSEDPGLPEIFKPGSAEAVMYLLIVLQAIAQNFVLRDDGGTSGLGNSAVIENLMLVFTIIIAGSTDAIFPMASAYHGEQNDSGMLMVKRSLAKTGYLLLLMPLAVLFIFPELVIMPFSIDDAVMLRTLPFAIRLVCVNHLLIQINTLLIDYLSAIEKEGRANLAFIIQSFVEIPLILILNRWSDMNSPWYAGLIAEFVVLIYLFFFCDHLPRGLFRYYPENLLLLKGGKFSASSAEEMENAAGEFLPAEQLALVKRQMMAPLLAALPDGLSPDTSFTILERKDGRKAAILRYASKKDFLEDGSGIPETDSDDDGDDEEGSGIPFDTCIRSEFLGIHRLMIVFDNNTSREE